ncbi:MAG: O-antigen ligase family protein [Bacteroidales bacterium]|nr:O-antigen ligase family protein [Bacteroidales bacterium]
MHRLTGHNKYSKKELTVIAVLTLLFLVTGAVAVDYEFYIFAFIPVIILGVLLIMLKFYYSVFLVALLTPVSIIFRMEAFSVTVPTEPILIIVMLLFLWESFLSKSYDAKALHSPITKIIFINLGWMLIASLFSWDVTVSLKYLISRLWFVIPCYFMMVPIFKDVKTFRWFVALYGFSLSIIIIICTIKFAMVGFAFREMNQIPSPFYNDHTAYGAAIGLFIPVSLYYTFGNKEICPTKAYRILFIFISSCLLVGLILSYARATWVSVMAAVGIFVLIWSKIKLKTILTLGTIVLLLGLLFSETIIQTLESNSQDSSGNLEEHMSSITNISTDASNTERINRWACALRMFKERPVTGWGPGTYQFIYGSYQHYAQRTIISTNEGTLGNAHSEYIGPLCEQGAVGCLIVIVMFSTTVFIGIKTFRTAKDKNTAWLSLFITLSLITYYTHGFMNNFLDTDKLSVPVWAFMAMVSSLYTYSEKLTQEKKIISQNNLLKQRFILLKRRFILRDSNNNKIK